MNANFNFLSKPYQDSRLAHFYHIKTLQKSSEEALVNLLIAWFKKLSIKNPTDHSDILWIGLQDENNYYVVDQFKEVFKFQHYRPLSLKTKFIVITNAAKLNENISNKLLKTLEEPSNQTTIILLNPESNQLLATVQSRALNFTLNLALDEEYKQLAQEAGHKIQSGMTLNEFLGDYKKIPNVDQKILKGILAQQEKYPHQQLLELTKSIEEAALFHSAITNRLTHIYYFLN